MQKRVSIIIPAYNEEAGIGGVLRELIESFGDRHEIIVVDDGSTDGTAKAVGEFSGVRLIRHRRNFGYGAALKTGILNSTSELVCFFDADGQHNPEDITRLLEAAPNADMVVGARGRSAFKLIRRMPGKLLLGLVARLLTSRKIPDLNSGLRLVRRQIMLRYIHLLPDKFSATTTMTMIMLVRNYTVVYIPITVRKRVGVSQVRQFRDGLGALLLLVRMILLFNPMRFFLPLGVFLLVPGMIYGMVMLYLVGIGFPVGGLLIILTGLLSLVFGLVCDQISAMRLELFERQNEYNRYKMDNDEESGNKA